MPPTIPISRRGLLGTLASLPVWPLAGGSWSRTMHPSDATTPDPIDPNTPHAQAATPNKATPRDPPGPGEPPDGVLFADSKSQELADAPALYDGLIGSWDVDAIDHAPDGTRRTSTGEWHFMWALEGRAVQDVLIVPRREDRFAGMPRQGNRYGTTVRFFDPARKAWRIVWFNPVTGALNTLDARKDGDRIVQEGDLAPGIRLRWSFVDIKRNSFHWVGEFSTDGGATWVLQAEFLGKRTPPGHLR